MYKLPKLQYDYQDLEPYIDTHTVGLHYRIHMSNYLTKLNELLQKNNYDYRYNIDELIYHLNEFNGNDIEDILYNLGGVLNHTLYFKIMNIPQMCQKPFGNLLLAIQRDFGSVDKFYELFKENALKIKGSGYTFLVLTSNGRLMILNLANQQTPFSLGYIPLFTIDMWEHAYYLNYKSDKIKYVDNFKNIADFSNANTIYNNIVK